MSIKKGKVLIKPVEENVAHWIPEGKDGRLRWENTSYSYDVPLTQANLPAKILTEEERKWLEEAIDKTRPDGWLSPYIRGINNVWIGKNRYKLEISDKGIELDLSDPVDYIKYKIALAQTHDIAPTFAQRRDKKYLFYMEFIEELEKQKIEKVDKLMNATEYFSKIKDNKEKLRNLLLVINKGNTAEVPKDIKLSTVKTRVFQFLNDRTSMFLDIIEDEDYKYKVLYYKALETGAFEKVGFEIRDSAKNGKLIGNSMTEALNYIKEMENDQENQQAYAVFLQRIKS